MSTPEGWLARRQPPPPPELTERVVDTLAASGRAGATLEALAVAARAELERARARRGRVRESALHLLVADALLTYACEAALESDDPEAALLALLARGPAP